MVEAIVDGLPWSIALGQIAPLGSGVEFPEDTIDDHPVILPGMAPFGCGCGQMGLEDLPLDITEFVSLDAHRLRRLVVHRP